MFADPPLDLAQVTRGLAEKLTFVYRSGTRLCALKVDLAFGVMTRRSVDLPKNNVQDVVESTFANNFPNEFVIWAMAVLGGTSKAVVVRSVEFRRSEETLPKTITAVPAL